MRAMTAPRSDRTDIRESIVQITLRPNGTQLTHIHSTRYQMRDNNSTVASMLRTCQCAHVSVVHVSKVRSKARLSVTPPPGLRHVVKAKHVTVSSEGRGMATCIERQKVTEGKTPPNL